MLYDPLSEAYYKLSEHSCRIIQMMDRPCKMQDFLKRAADAGLTVTEEELADIILFLDQNSLFVPEYGRTGKKYESYKLLMEKSRILRAASVYLFFKLPPIYPDRFFTATAPAAKLVFNRYSVMFLVIAALCGYILLARQWHEACDSFINSLSWAGLVNYFWALLVTKSIHELSHGYTAKVLGAKVRAMGVSFIVFYPRLFVDLTDSWRLPRHQRLLCDSAGIISELIFGGLAAAVWVYAPPGPLKSTMFYLFAVSTLGTLLVNGNPFIRYDGYYILTDILNIENLMTRSSEYLKSFNRRFFLGLGSYPDAGDCSGAALYFFGAASFIYRIFLYTSIILLVYFQFAFAKPVAIVLMGLELFTMILLPLWRELKLLGTARKKVSKVKACFTLLLLAAVFSLFFIPFPWSLDLPCEITAENKVLVTMDEGAFASERLEDLLALLGIGNVVGVDGNHVVVTLALGSKNGQSFLGVAGGDDTVGNLGLDQLCGHLVADIGQSDPVAEGAQTVSAAGTDVSAGQGILVQAFHIFHKAGLLQLQGQNLAHSGGGGGDMLEGGGAGHAGGFLQFLDQLPGVQGVHEVDVAGTAAEDGDGQLAAVVHVQGSRLLIGIAAILEFKVLHIKNLH